MKTTPMTFEDLSASVLAVPPLARRADLTLNPEENRKLIRHIEGGGVKALLYGGNANFYHIGVGEYALVLQHLAESAATGTWVVPSVGPMYGTMMDQARVLRDFEFPSAMILPAAFPSSPAGVETGIRRFVDAFGRPAILYIKNEGYIGIDGVSRLIRDSLIHAVKYAVVRDDPRKDSYLRALVDTVDHRYVISGIGEQPAIVHMRDFGLCGFTSGCVCVAPRRSMQMLEALRAKDYSSAERIRESFRPLEALRNQHGPIPVLHEAISLCGIAETGAILPLATNLVESLRPAVREAAQTLLAYEREVTVSPAAAARSK